jgi:hypothetical protein
MINLRHLMISKYNLFHKKTSVVQKNICHYLKVRPFAFGAAAMA